MKEHTRVTDLLPFYASGTLDEDDRRMVQAHLEQCQECRDDLALWQAVSAEVKTANQSSQPQPALVEAALGQIRQKKNLPGMLRQAAHLVWAQIPLVRQEIWPASALVMLIGCAVAWIANHASVIYLIAPLVAAAGVALVYGPENDPAIELTLATPTSPHQVLLARLLLVFSYNLALALAASLLLATIMPGELIGSLILGWLGPMTLLSMLAVMLSMWLGASNAAVIAYLAWLGRWMAAGTLDNLSILGASPLKLAVLSSYIHIWQNPLAVILLSLGFLAASLWLVGKSERKLPRWV